MLKYAVTALFLAMGVAAVIYTARLEPTKAPAEQTITERRAPHADELGGPVRALAGEVIETMNAGRYTYVHVDTGTEKIWIAGPETAVQVGDKVSFVTGVEMHDFSSPTINRTFRSIQFVSAINTGERAVLTPEGHPPVTASPGAGEMDFSGVYVPDGGKSVADVHAERDALAGERVIVRGKVVKFTAGVMGKNWIHLMDGTGGAGADDLTVTTDAVVRVGDVITVDGRIGTNKDLGFGYKYDVIIENAIVTVDT